MKNEPLPLLSTAVSAESIQGIGDEIETEIPEADLKILNDANALGKVRSYLAEAYLANQPVSLLMAVAATSTWREIAPYADRQDILKLSDDDLMTLANRALA
jgi:hypothetical protein